MTDLGLTFKITHFMRIGKIIARPFFGSAHLLDFLPNLGGIVHTKKLCHFMICDTASYVILTPSVILLG